MGSDYCCIGTGVLHDQNTLVHLPVDLGANNSELASCGYCLEAAVECIFQTFCRVVVDVWWEDFLLGVTIAVDACFANTPCCRGTAAYGHAVAWERRGFPRPSLCFVPHCFAMAFLFYSHFVSGVAKCSGCNVGRTGTGLCSVMQLYLHLPSSITNLPCLEDEAEYAEYDSDRGVQVHFPGVAWVLHDEDGVVGGRQ